MPPSEVVTSVTLLSIETGPPIPLAALSPPRSPIYLCECEARLWLPLLSFTLADMHLLLPAFLAHLPPVRFGGLGLGHAPNSLLPRAGCLYVWSQCLLMNCQLSSPAHICVDM